MSREVTAAALKKTTSGIEHLKKILTLLDLTESELTVIASLLTKQERRAVELQARLKEEETRLDKAAAAIEQRRKRRRRDDIAITHKKSGFTTYRKRADGSFGNI